MKEVREGRFIKKEDVGFNPTPLINAPPMTSSGEVKLPVRSNERTEVTNERTFVASSTAYVVTIPLARRKTRQSFDIFEDQYEALKKLQLAEADQAEHQHRKMGEMVQEALDAFIKERARKLGTVSIRKEHE